MPSFMVRPPRYRWPSAPSECHQPSDQNQNLCDASWAPLTVLTNLQQSTSKATKPETDRIRKEEDARQQAEADRLENERLVDEELAKLAAELAALKKQEEARKLAEAERIRKEEEARQQAEADRLENERLDDDELDI